MEGIKMLQTKQQWMQYLQILHQVHFVVVTQPRTAWTNYFTCSILYGIAIELHSDWIDEICHQYDSDLRNCIGSGILRLAACESLLNEQQLSNLSGDESVGDRVGKHYYPSKSYHLRLKLINYAIANAEAQLAKLENDK